MKNATREGGAFQCTRLPHAVRYLAITFRMENVSEDAPSMRSVIPLLAEGITQRMRRTNTGTV